MELPETLPARLYLLGIRHIAGHEAFASRIRQLVRGVQPVSRVGAALVALAAGAELRAAISRADRRAYKKRIADLTQHRPGCPRVTQGDPPVARAAGRRRLVRRVDRASSAPRPRRHVLGRSRKCH